MIGFLPPGFEQRLAGRGIAGKERLPLIQGLGGNFAGVIDAHECGDFPAVGGSINGFVDTRGGVGAAGSFGSKQCSQGLVCGFDQPVDQGNHPASASGNGWNVCHGHIIYVVFHGPPTLPAEGWQQDK